MRSKGGLGVEWGQTLYVDPVPGKCGVNDPLDPVDPRPLHLHKNGDEHFR